MDLMSFIYSMEEKNENLDERAALSSCDRIAWSIHPVVVQVLPILHNFQLLFGE